MNRKKQQKNERLKDYIFIRVGESIKGKIKERAKKEGSNMTIWTRQLIIKTLETE